MALDAKYRPRRYEDVLGQAASVAMLQGYVAHGRGFSQSYVFAGAYGSGKTTLARILARALLCDAPQKGAPCDACSSCTALLTGKPHDAFVEVDAATHSGKAQVEEIVESLSFDAFSGRHRVFLWDEAHELSRQAMDAMLLPMEESWPGSEERKMVCIFCTTEVEKMRPAILSRCAPVFRIRPNTPEQIAERLAQVCVQEGITFEPRALVLIAEATECHIRDCYKALEGISLLGALTAEIAKTYLQLDVISHLESVLDSLDGDLATCLSLGEAVLQRVSAMTAYERLAEMAMATYRLTLGQPAGIPSFWDRERLRGIGERLGGFLLRVVAVLTGRPPQFSSSTLLCDLALLHQERHGVGVTMHVVPRPAPPKIQGEVGKVKQPSTTEIGVFVNPQAQNVHHVSPAAPTPIRAVLTPTTFQSLLRERFQKLSGVVNGSEGSTHVGSA